MGPVHVLKANTPSSGPHTTGGDRNGATQMEPATSSSITAIPGTPFPCPVCNFDLRFPMCGHRIPAYCCPSDSTVPKPGPVPPFPEFGSTHQRAWRRRREQEAESCYLQNPINEAPLTIQEGGVILPMCVKCLWEYTKREWSPSWTDLRKREKRGVWVVFKGKLHDQPAFWDDEGQFWCQEGVFWGQEGIPLRPNLSAPKPMGRVEETEAGDDKAEDNGEEELASDEDDDGPEEDQTSRLKTRATMSATMNATMKKSDSKDEDEPELRRQMRELHIGNYYYSNMLEPALADRDSAEGMEIDDA
ncbi:hypothetical protein V8F20_006611 [Naviculisporaceae sp. PSN 640]